MTAHPRPDPIPPCAEFCTATQAINSPRWPFTRFTFYRRIKPKLTEYRHSEGARPVYKVAEISAIYTPTSVD